MKLTYRDKVVLITLVVILVWVLGVMFFIKPKFEDLDQANKDYDTAVAELENKKALIKADEGLEDRVKEAYQESIKVAENFYDKMTSDEVSTQMDNLLDEDGITNDSLSISQYSQATLSYINAVPVQLETDVDRLAQQSAELGKTASEDIQEVTADTERVKVPAYTVSFGYSCTLEQLQSFLDKLLTRNEKSLVVTNCTIGDINEEEITGQMTMVLMMMPRLQNPLEANKTAEAAS